MIIRLDIGIQFFWFLFNLKLLMDFLAHFMIVTLEKVDCLFQRFEHLIRSRCSISHIQQMSHTGHLPRFSSLILFYVDENVRYECQKLLLVR